MSRPQSQGKLGSPSGPVANAETEGSATGHQEHEMTSKAVGEHTPIMGSSERLTAAGPVSSGTGAQMAMSPDNVDGHAYESSLHAVTDPQPVEGRFPTHVNHQDFAYQAQVTPPSGHPESVEPHLSGGSTAQQSGLRWDIPDRTEEEKDQHGEGSSTDDEDEADVFAFQPPTTTMPNATASSSSPDQSSASTADMIEEAPATYTASRKYDMSHPPPYSGRNNMNNSVFPFAFGPDTQMRRRGPDSRPSRPDTGAATDASRNDLSTAATLDTEVTEEAPRSRQHRFLRPFSSRFGRPSTKESNSTYSTEPNWITEDSRPPRTARSTGGVTDMSGDATIPDGVTTWGDGVGGEFKDLGSDLESPEGDYVDEDSPYAEVRASVSNMDDPDMPALTLRAWVIGMLLTLIGSAANTFFYFRNPAPHIPLLVVQVVAYPIGRFAALVLPIREWTVPRWLGGWSFSLNPCPFNVKEHTIIVMMAQVAISAPYGLGTIVATELWYHRPLGVGFSFIYIIATQLTGLSMAGIARRFVVWPASMIWPGVLVLTTNLNTLHAASDGGTGGVSRLRFFTIATIAAFVYYFIPGAFFALIEFLLTTRLPVRWSLVLFVHLLGSTEEQGCQSIVRCQLGPRYGRPYLRLEPDCLDWLATRQSVVGSSERWNRVCPVLLDHCANIVLHECTSAVLTLLTTDLVHKIPSNHGDASRRSLPEGLQCVRYPHPRVHIERDCIQPILASLPSGEFQHDLHGGLRSDDLAGRVHNSRSWQTHCPDPATHAGGAR